MCELENTENCVKNHMFVFNKETSKKELISQRNSDVFTYVHVYLMNKQNETLQSDPLLEDDTI